MSKATDDFKALLVRNKGKLKPGHFPKIIAFVDNYVSEFTAAGEKDYIKKLLGEAFNMEPQRIQDVFECGTKELAAFKDDFTHLMPCCCGSTGTNGVGRRRCTNKLVVSRATETKKCKPRRPTKSWH